MSEHSTIEDRADSERIDNPTQTNPQAAVKPRISAARLAANRENAKKSTGPRTPEGKYRSPLNATRHGILAQVIHLPEENSPPTTNSPATTSKPCPPRSRRDANSPTPAPTSSSASTASPPPSTTCSPSATRNNGDLWETGHPESHTALAFAETLRRSKDPLATLTIYEQRLSRRFLQTLKQLQAMQAERRALEQQQLDEIYIIARQHPSEAETIEPADFGFVCSTSDWKQYLKRRILLESRQPGADKWPKPFNSRQFIRKVA